MMVSLFLQTLKPPRVGTLTTLSSRLSRLMRRDLSICQPGQELDFKSIAKRSSDIRLPAKSSNSRAKSGGVRFAQQVISSSAERTVDSSPAVYCWGCGGNRM